MKHNYLICRGVLCEADPTPDWKKWVVWYPSEPMCEKKRFSKIQKTQRKIQNYYKKGQLKHGDRFYFTGEMLETLKFVRPGVKGRTPNLTNK